MLTRARSARGGGTGSLHPPYDSSLGSSNDYLTPQRRKTYVLSSKRGGSSLSTSESRLISRGSSQGVP
jgi:hypothetical protein